MNQNQIFSLIRAALLSVGTADLVNKGIVSSSDLETVVSALMILAALGWSYIHHAAPVTTTPPPSGNLRGPGVLLFILAGLITFSAGPLCAQTNTPAPAPANASSFWPDLAGDILQAQAFTSNGCATVFAGGGLNTSSGKPVYGLLAEIPMGKTVSFAFGAGYLGGDLLDGSGSVALNYQLSLLATNDFTIGAGDGVAWDCTKSIPGNFQFTQLDERFPLSQKLALHAGVMEFNLSTLAGVNFFAGAGLEYDW